MDPKSHRTPHQLHHGEAFQQVGLPQPTVLLHHLLRLRMSETLTPRVYKEVHRSLVYFAETGSGRTEPLPEP